MPSVFSARGLELMYRVIPGAPLHCLGSVRGHSSARDHSSIEADGACRNPVQRGSKRCVPCSINDALHASSLHHAHNRDRIEIDPEVRRHLAQPNDLYLAAFRDGSIKVGTSSAWRTEERLTEQGAWLALIVARTTDGYEVRNLEDAVTRKLGIPQSVATTRKVRGLLQPTDDSTLLAKLNATARDVATLPDFDQRTDRSVEPRTWRNEHAMAGPFRGRLHEYPHRLNTGAHQVRIVDLCGRVAAVTTVSGDGVLDDGVSGGDVLVVDLGQIFGVEHEIGRFSTDEIALQGSLF